MRPHHHLRVVVGMLIVVFATSCGADPSADPNGEVRTSVERGFTKYEEEELTTDMSGGTTTCAEVGNDLQRNIRGWRSKGSPGAEPTESTVADWRCSWFHDGPIPPQSKWKYPYPPFSSIVCDVGTSYDPARDDPTMQHSGFTYIDDCDLTR